MPAGPQPAIRVRPLVPGDVTRVAAMVTRCSADTLYTRFLAPVPPPAEDSSMLRRLVDVDQVNDVAMVAELDGRVIGLGSYHRQDDPDTVEVALLVEDAHQRRGVGTLLARELAAHALERGVRRFRGDALATNSGSLGLARGVGLEPTIVNHEGVVKIVFEVERRGDRREIG